MNVSNSREIIATTRLSEEQDVFRSSTNGMDSVSGAITNSLAHPFNKLTEKTNDGFQTTTVSRATFQTTTVSRADFQSSTLTENMPKKGNSLWVHY